MLSGLEIITSSLSSKMSRVAILVGSSSRLQAEIACSTDVLELLGISVHGKSSGRYKDGGSEF